VSPSGFSLALTLEVQRSIENNDEKETISAGILTG
jgi:hypothetical protein